jgi:hypothetical protein
MKILIVVQDNADGSDTYLYNVGAGDSASGVFKRWKDDRRYRKDLKNVKVYRLVDITKETIK